jgi:hypothetical protein
MSGVPLNVCAIKVIGLNYSRTSLCLCSLMYTVYIDIKYGFFFFFFHHLFALFNVKASSPVQSLMVTRLIEAGANPSKVRDEEGCG